MLYSPAVAILCGLERDGFSVQLEPDDAIVIAPRSRLTPKRMGEIAEHKAALKLLLRFLDPGVVDRRDAFRRQLDAAPSGVLVPRLVFREAPVCQRTLPCLRRGAGARALGFLLALLAGPTARVPRAGSHRPVQVKAYDEARICA